MSTEYDECGVRKETEENKWDPMWFLGFCNEKEIERIVNPQCPQDYLLRKRADIVADHARYNRVFRYRARQTPNWSFEDSFETVHYKSVIDNLSAEDRIQCNDILFGDMFSNTVNGFAWKDDDCGRIISLNEGMSYFMRFSNLSLLTWLDIPKKFCLNSLRIAVRIFLGVESMDFILDPRGIIPRNVLLSINHVKKYELQSVAGHEFAHHLCGHLKDEQLVKGTLLSLDGITYEEKFYTKRQGEEFQADIEALNRPNYSKEEYFELAHGSLVWFASVMIGETAKSVINPLWNSGIQTHPSACDRFSHILDNMKFKDDGFQKNMRTLYENAVYLSDVIREDISCNYEWYEMYGSAYLDEPNTEWRGKELKDTIDY